MDNLFYTWQVSQLQICRFFAAFNLIIKHKVTDLAAASEGLCKHGFLFSCRMQSVLNCFVCHLACLYNQIICVWDQKVFFIIPAYNMPCDISFEAAIIILLRNTKVRKRRVYRNSSHRLHRSGISCSRRVKTMTAAQFTVWQFDGF